MSGLILFDDGFDQISPLADLRASFEIRSGALLTAARLSDQADLPIVSVAAASGQIEALLAETWTEVAVGDLPEIGDAFLVINGRCTRLPDVDRLTGGQAWVDADGSVLAARLGRSAADDFLGNLTLPDSVDTAEMSEIDGVLRRPWHVVSYLKSNLSADLAMMTKDGGRTDLSAACLGDHPITVNDSVTLDPGVVLDARGGSIVIDSDAAVGAHAVIEGPVYVGKGAVVSPHSHIRGNTVIGPVCKVGGEVGGSVLQGFSNKGHYGYLGDSYLGEWVNLGAGTTTSNLKNTYGEVRMQHSPDPVSVARDVAEPTGLQFLGSVIGDHVKTAIGTRLLTGTCVHTGAMIATADFPPKSIERFAFLSDDLHPATGCYDLHKFLAVADLVMRRRDRAMTPAIRDRIRSLHHDA